MLAGVVGPLVTVVVTGGVVIGRQLASHSTASQRNPPVAVAPAPLKPAQRPELSASKPAPLEADFAQLAQKMDAKFGIVVTAVGDSKKVVTLGDWKSGPAWSTIKVPLDIAAYRETAEITEPMKATITESDNAAAEAIWQNLGDPTTAAHHVEAVLQDYGDMTTTVQSQRVRPEFTAFGQTDWSLANQATFLAGAVCRDQNRPIFELMGQIAPDQSWGLGNISDARFKGGWGPSTAGNYLVRQIGVLFRPAGTTVIAMAAEPASGSFGDGVHDLTEVANWLNEHLAELPAGECGG